MRQAADASVVEQDRSPRGPARSVLVVDHQEVHRRIVALLLEPLHCALSFAANGEEAVRVAASQPFDAILMDMQLPVIHGLDAARVIRTGHGPNASTLIVALSASAMDADRAAWVALGVDTFLTKPIAPSLLLEALIIRPATMYSQAVA